MSRIIFAGTPAFARESLRALVNAGRRPELVLTQPDRPAGRGKKLTPSEVKVFADAEGLPVWQPQSLKDAAVVAKLKAVNADLMIVAAYGLLLPASVLDLPRVACVNVHASLLPRWRGAAPIQSAILAGDPVTGISLMQMEAGLDTGPVYAESEIDIRADETAGELHDRLAALGGEMLVQHLDAILAGELVAQRQDDSKATYAAKIRPSDAAIDWQQPAEIILRGIRAYNPVPGAWTMYRGERIKCWRADVANADGSRSATAGEVIGTPGNAIDVACGGGGGGGVLRLLEMQRPGRKRVTAAELASQLGLPGQRFEQA